MSDSLDVDNLEITLSVDGEERQHASTSDMIHKVADVVSFVSHTFTLLPGDVIMTGTPAGGAPVYAGDRVDITIEGIGTLSNPVVRR